MPYRKNVFILGAGASAAAGAPVMREFLPRARDIALNPRSGLDADGRRRFNSVFAYRFGLSRAEGKVPLDFDHLEELFGFVDLECRLGKAGASEVRADLVFLIAKTLELSTGMGTDVPGPGDKRHREPPFTYYGGFIRWLARLEKHPEGPWYVDREHESNDAIITFNYDLVMETGMMGAGVAPDYRLTGVTPTLPSSGQSFQGYVPYLKLHGSSNWLRCPECPDGTVHVSWKRILRCQKHDKVLQEPIIVPPTWDKGGGRAVLDPIWQAARDHLVTAHRWIIIGYSAPASDRFFQYLIASCAAENENLESVTIVDPDRESATTRYSELFSPLFRSRKVKFQAQRFAHGDDSLRLVANLCGRPRVGPWW